MNDRRIRWIAVLPAAIAGLSAQNPAALKVYSAGSLREAILQTGAEYQKETGVRIEPTFGPSGVLRERIEGGERPDIFTSADMASPRRLAEEGLGSPVREFTANAVCAVVRADSGIDTTNLTDTLVNPKTRIGAGTPVADPLGDYTEDIFATIDKTHPGAKKTLDDKAQRLIGGRGPSPVPQGKDGAAWYLIDGRQIDVMLTYCSGADSTVRREHALRVVQLPDPLAVRASYGYTIVTGANPKAADFARFLESEPARRILRENGFLTQ